MLIWTSTWLPFLLWSVQVHSVLVYKQVGHQQRRSLQIFRLYLPKPSTLANSATLCYIAPLEMFACEILRSNLAHFNYCFCPGNCCWHSSFQDGIYVCGKSLYVLHIFSQKCPQHCLWNIWLTMALSCPFKEDNQVLPLFMPLSFSWSVVWCP